MVPKAMKSMPAMKSKAKPYYTKCWRTSWVGKYVRWRLKSITRARCRITEEWTGVRRKYIPKVMKAMIAATALPTTCGAMNLQSYVRAGNTTRVKTAHLTTQD